MEIVLRTRNPTHRPVLPPGAAAPAASPSWPPTSSCAAGGATAPASPPLLCSNRWCCAAPHWRPPSCTGTHSPPPQGQARAEGCATAPTGSTSAGGSGSRLTAVTRPSPAAACRGSGRSTRARTDSTAASDPKEPQPFRSSVMEICQRTNCGSPIWSKPKQDLINNI